jgi:hypothetical protein
MMCDRVFHDLTYKHRDLDHVFMGVVTQCLNKCQALAKVMKGSHRSSRNLWDVPRYVPSTMCCGLLPESASKTLLINHEDDDDADDDADDDDDDDDADDDEDDDDEDDDDEDDEDDADDDDCFLVI